MPGLHILHINARSVVSKVDMIRIWVCLTGADILVVSETWLSKFIQLAIDGFNIVRSVCHLPEIILLDDFNWDLLSSVSDYFKHTACF